jgi:putative addiction module killer protein
VPEIRQTAVFSRWLSGLRDSRARTRIQTRMDRLAIGNPGDVRPVGSGISEMRINYGPGYRVYLVQHGTAVVILLLAVTNEPRIGTSRRHASLHVTSKQRFVGCPTHPGFVLSSR